jgi:hypothetical protein
MSKVKEAENQVSPPSEISKTSEAVVAPEESVAFQTGRKARAMGVSLRSSALRVIRPGGRQYYDFIDGYEAETEARRRKKKPALVSTPPTKTA